MQEPSGVMGGGSSAGVASPAANGSTSGAAGVQSPAPAGSVIPGSSGESVSSNPEESNPLFPRFKEVNDKYGKLKWAEAYDNPEQVSQAVALRQWVQSDPKGFFAYLRSQMEAHGHLEQTPREPPKVPQAPQADYVDPQTGLKVFSADRAHELVRFYVDQLKGEIDGRVKPVEQFLGTAATRMRAQHEARGIIANAETNWPHFKDHKQAIFDAMGKNKALSLSEAYISVVVPAIGNKERQGLLNELDQKPGATTASPASAQGGGRENLSKLPFSTLVAREMRKRGLGR